MNNNFNNMFELDKNNDEPLFDENGQEIIITRDIPIVTQTKTISTEAGLIEDNNTEQLIREENINDSNLVIYFAELDNNAKGNLEMTNQWVMTENNNGSFFIFSEDDCILDKWLVLVDSSDNTIVWESAIMKLPSDSIKVGTEDKLANYMTKRAIYKSNMPIEDGVYFAKIEDLDTSLFALNITVADENLINAEEIYLDEELYLPENINLDENYDTNDNFLKNLDENHSFDDIITQQENSNQIEKEIDLFDMLANEYLKKKRTKLQISDFEIEDYCLEADLVIEKINNTYTANFRGFNNKNIKLLDGEKPYFEFNYGIELFLQKIETILINMFNFTKEEIENFKKVILTDEEYESSCNNTQVITRENAIGIISNKGINLVYINSSKTYISLIKEERRIEIEDYNNSNLLLELLDKENNIDIIIINDVDDNCSLIKNLM